MEKKVAVVEILRIWDGNVLLRLFLVVVINTKTAQKTIRSIAKRPLFISHQ